MCWIALDTVGVYSFCRRKTKNESQEREQDRVFIQNLKSIQDSSSAWGVKGSSDRIKVNEVRGNESVN